MGGLFSWDKVDHFIAYFGLAGMATLVLGLRPRLAWAILGVILMSGGLEILQAFTGRDAELLDFAANSPGALRALWPRGLSAPVPGPRACSRGRPD